MPYLLCLQQLNNGLPTVDLSHREYSSSTAYCSLPPPGTAYSHPHAFRPLAEQKWSVGFPKTDKTSVSCELDDHLAHLADGACRGTHGLWQGNGQEVRVESGDFHTSLSDGQRSLACSTLLACCTLNCILHSRAMHRASKVWAHFALSPCPYNAMVAPVPHRAREQHEERSVLCPLRNPYPMFTKNSVCAL